MARPLRIEFPGAIYHITSRGNARQAIFLEDQDRHTFLETLAEVVGRFGWLCYADCLMGNHYHLLVETPQARCSRPAPFLGCGRECLRTDAPQGTIPPMGHVTVTKSEVLDLVKELPDDIDIEDLIYRLYLREKLAAAEADITAGRTVSVAEARSQAASWRK